MSEFDPTAPVTVTLHTPADLVASLPALLGFSPARSLVAIAIVDRDDRQQLAAMARVDLPATGSVQVGEYAEALVARLATSDPAWVQLVVITDEPGLDAALGLPPRAGLVEAFSAAFAAAGIDTRTPLWAARVAAGAPWRCYDPRGCCAGTLPDPGASTLAAHTTLAGRVTYASRDEAADALAPDPDEELHWRPELLDEAHRCAQASRVADPSQAARQDLEVVRGAIAATGRGETLEVATLARIVVALWDPAVRDVCIGFAAGRDQTIDAAAAEALWWRLTRATPAPAVAEPATLLAFAALRHGGGVTLSVALERAVRADPGHRLSRLLGQIVDAGLPAHVIEDMVLGAADEAEQLFHR